MVPSSRKMACTPMGPSSLLPRIIHNMRTVTFGLRVLNKTSLLSSLACSPRTKLCLRFTVMLTARLARSTAILIRPELKRISYLRTVPSMTTSSSSTGIVQTTRKTRESRLQHRPLLCRRLITLFSIPVVGPSNKNGEQLSLCLRSRSSAPSRRRR